MVNHHRQQKCLALFRSIYREPARLLTPAGYNDLPHQAVQKTRAFTNAETGQKRGQKQGGKRRRKALSLPRFQGLVSILLAGDGRQR